MINVHMPRMLHKDVLLEHPRNSNKQSKHMYKELRESIRVNGFDEVLTVVPRDEEDGFWIVSGNHRFRAGVAEGMEEFPCVVREDWDAVQQQIELVRRNYVRGNLNRESFTAAVDVLTEENSLSLDDVREMMGFEDEENFMKLYQDEENQLNDMVDDYQKTSAPAVKMLDDLGVVLSEIFEQYGDTVPNSFIIFPAGNKKHMYVAATPAIINIMQEIADYSLSNHMDINIVLGGILAIGKYHSHLNTEDPDKESIKKEGSNKEGPEEL